LASPPTRLFSDVSTSNGDTLEEDLDLELKFIRNAGIRRVVMVDLSKPEFALPVVRIIVPELEPILEFGYRPGRRGRIILATQQ
jgi:ribosomal protein S12 methylthiotransferase accessory factor YcaO